MVVHMAAHHTADTASLFAEEKTTTSINHAEIILKCISVHVAAIYLSLARTNFQYSESIKFIQFHSLVESAFIYTHSWTIAWRREGNRLVTAVIKDIHPLERHVYWSALHTQPFSWDFPILSSSFSPIRISTGWTKEKCSHKRENRFTNINMGCEKWPTHLNRSGENILFLSLPEYLLSLKLPSMKNKM